jgi:alpha-D-xyloside xylohydrolase
MPYVYAQAKDCSDHGLPMVRALFVEYPDDPGSWQVEDEYLYGSSILVAPLMHKGATDRAVYLPPGTWIDYQSGKVYAGGWQQITAGPIPEVILVRDGTVLPRIALAQCTAQMDWSQIELVVYARNATTANGLLYLPGDKATHEISVNAADATLKLASDPYVGKVSWTIRKDETQ